VRVRVRACVCVCVCVWKGTSRGRWVGEIGGEASKGGWKVLVLDVKGKRTRPMMRKRSFTRLWSSSSRCPWWWWRWCADKGAGGFILTPPKPRPAPPLGPLPAPGAADDASVRAAAFNATLALPTAGGRPAALAPCGLRPPPSVGVAVAPASTKLLEPRRKGRRPSLSSRFTTGHAADADDEERGCGALLSPRGAPIAAAAAATAPAVSPAGPAPGLASGRGRLRLGLPLVPDAAGGGRPVYCI
jgi:hypothetical protein